MILFTVGLNNGRSPYSRAVRVLHIFTHLYLIFSLLILPVRSNGQDDSDMDVVRVRTDLVTVPALVMDTRGNRLGNLGPQDFELRDDGRVVKIEYFATGTEHVALMFALDVSGSTRDIMRQQYETARALFARFGRESEVAVMYFAEKALLITPFFRALDDALKPLSLPLNNRRTAIFDACASAIRTFDERRANPAERRIIILISDGLDTVSATRPRAVIEAARMSGVSIYAIHLPLYGMRDGRLVPRPVTKGFRELAEETGGRYFRAGDAKSALSLNPVYDLSPIFQAIEEDLRGQYVLGYYPAEASRDGRAHRLVLNLTVKDKRKIRVRQLREGYTLRQ